MKRFWGAVERILLELDQMLKELKIESKKLQGGAVLDMPLFLVLRRKERGLYPWVDMETLKEEKKGFK